MAGRESRLRKQKAVYWACSGVTDGGRVTLAAYSEIHVQWLEKRAEMADPHGNVISVDVQLTVGQELTIGSIVASGAYDDYAAADMKYEVVAYSEQRDSQNRHVRRTAGLKRYGVELPDLA